MNLVKLPLVGPLIERYRAKVEQKKVAFANEVDRTATILMASDGRLFLAVQHLAWDRQDLYLYTRNPQRQWVGHLTSIKNWPAVIIPETTTVVKETNHHADSSPREKNCLGSTPISDNAKDFWTKAKKQNKANSDAAAQRIAARAQRNGRGAPKAKK